MNLGVPEIILILVVALLFFGPSRLPSLGKSVGEAIRGFKKGLSNPPDEDPSSPSGGDKTQLSQSTESPMGGREHEKKKENQNS